ELPKGNRQYRIVGFFNSLMQNGDYAIVAEKYFRADTGERYFEDMYIKTSIDPKIVADELKSRFSRVEPIIYTMAELEQMNMDMNNQMFAILRGFSLMTLLIGIFGVVNNLIISFMERKRSLAVLRSIGMSKKQIVKLIFVEGLTGGFVGGTVGVMAGLLALSVVPYVMQALNVPIPMHYSASLFGNAIIAGIGITIVASVSPALKSAKLNIIEAIKHE
ncbi:MAG: FtsX-like permease family protein, partial [Bacillota bacterium]|nr:FtsX-like permease family protein [Bacillota bacterium]